MDEPKRSVIAGVFGGFAGVLGSHPLDTMKCRLQSQGSGKLPVRYNSGRSALYFIFKEEGIRGFYKGALPPFWMQGVINGIIFGVEDYAAKHMTSTKDSTSYKHFKTGMVAGFAQGFVCAPMELVKLHTQHQKIGEFGRYQGNWITLKSIWYREGIQGCYRGLTVTMVRDITGFGVYFATYEGLMDTLARKQNISRNEVSFAARFVFGGTAGVATWACNYPVDLAKTRFQLDGINGTERQYRGSWDALVKAWKDGGIRLLYRGLSATLVRGFVFNMFTLPVVDFMKQHLSHYAI